MNELDQLAAEIYRVSHIAGEFKLRSGLTSNEYFDKYLFESDPTLLRRIAVAMTKRARMALPYMPDFLAGLEMGGIPIATMMSSLSGINTLFVRKIAKQYGTCKEVEGPDVKGTRVVVIEDVVTTGGQIALSVDGLRELGAVVEDVYCVVDREKGGTENLAKSGLKLHPLFTASQLEKAYNER